MLKIIDNVLPKNALEFLHTFLINEPVWKLNMSSLKGANKIAGRILWDVNQNINSQTSSQALAAFVYHFIKAKAKFLPDNILRIQLAAKAPLQDDILHKDSNEDNAITVLYYLNTEWKKEWGGETIVGDKTVEYKPNRALIYNSSIIHGGKAPKIPIFRTYINYVVK
jgi:hypothetical protein